MNATDKKALKLIAERYGWSSKGQGLAGSIAGDRMLEVLRAANPSRDDIERVAYKFDQLICVRDMRLRAELRAEFLSLVESIAKIPPPL